MRLGFYSINLGTKWGQKLHTAHMLILPLIPIIIILTQCTNELWDMITTSAQINEVQYQVTLQDECCNKEVSVNREIRTKNIIPYFVFQPLY